MFKKTLLFIIGLYCIISYSFAQSTNSNTDQVLNDLLYYNYSPWGYSSTDKSLVNIITQNNNNKNINIIAPLAKKDGKNITSYYIIWGPLKYKDIIATSSTTDLEKIKSSDETTNTDGSQIYKVSGGELLISVPISDSTITNYISIFPEDINKNTGNGIEDITIPAKNNNGNIQTTTQTITTNQTTKFSITLSQNPIKKGEKIDMTIKALKSDGSVDTNYRGTIIMDLELTQDTKMYDLPSNGFYQFTAEDKGVKTFKKGLRINKSGTYTLMVFDSNVDSIVGTLPFVVGTSSQTKNITHSNTINPKTGYKRQYKNFTTFMSSEYRFTYKKSFANVNRYCKTAKLRGENTYFNENACEPMFKEIVQATNNSLDEIINELGSGSDSNSTGYKDWIDNRPEYKKSVIEFYNKKKSERLSVHDDIFKSLVIIFLMQVDYVIHHQIYNDF